MVEQDASFGQICPKSLTFIAHLECFLIKILHTYIAHLACFPAAIKKPLVSERLDFAVLGTGLESVRLLRTQDFKPCAAHTKQYIRTQNHAK
jgi:hypothetical protein